MDEETFNYITAIVVFSGGTELECYWEQEDSWIEVTPDKDGVIRFHPAFRYRRKPLTITLAGVEFPEPLRSSPEDGTICYVVTHVAVDVIQYYDDYKEHRDALAVGFIQETREGAEQQRRAMSLSVGGEP